jgi:ribonuclease G
LRRELLIAAGPGEWRAAWLEDGAAVELYVERGDILPAGSTHPGRVVRRVAGLGAALVDIGDERPGFLPLRRGDPRLDEGARVVVTVRREAQGGKGALLSRAESAAVEPVAGFAGALALRLPGKPERIEVDDAAALRELRTAFPAADVAQRDPALWPVDLDALFATALAPSLALVDGGTIHIEEGRTAVLIDVDSGSPESGSAERAALAVNFAAAAAIARQLRLRQLGGGIVVDFVGLDSRRARDEVSQAMAAALTADPAQPRVLGWSRLGHLEVVRPRRLRPLAEAMQGPLALAFAALRTLAREARADPAANWRLTVDAAVAMALSGPAAAALRGLEARLGRTILVSEAAARAAPPFDIAAR